MVQLTLSVNLIAFCCGGLFMGILGDKYGLRPVILRSLLLFITGSIICLQATSFIFLLVGRFFQGLGVAGPAILGYLIVADDLPETKQPEVLGVLSGLITFSMAISPVLGSYITYYFDWRYNFLVLLLLGIVCFSLSLLFLSSKQNKSNIKISLTTYKPLLLSRQILFFVLAICFLTFPYGIFIGISPLLYMGALGVPTNQFGFYQGIISLFFAVTSILSPKLFERFGQTNCFAFGLTLCSACILFFIFIGFYTPKNIYLITGCMILSAIGAVFPINILHTYCLNLKQNAKARINALILFFRLIILSFFLEVVGYFYNGKFLPIGIVLSLCLLIAILLIKNIIKRKEIIFKA